jgi:hypothetical protein
MKTRWNPKNRVGNRFSCLRGVLSTDWIWFLGVETWNHHGRVWEFEKEEGFEVLVEMAYSWSLERDGSEWIGLRGCWVTGRAQNSKTHGDRPPPLTQQIETKRYGSVPILHLGRWESRNSTEWRYWGQGQRHGGAVRPPPPPVKPLLAKIPPETLYR